jgi:hypothetical protein
MKRISRQEVFLSYRREGKTATLAASLCARVMTAYESMNRAARRFWSSVRENEILQSEMPAHRSTIKRERTAPAILDVTGNRVGMFYGYYGKNGTSGE